MMKPCEDIVFKQRIYKNEAGIGYKSEGYVRVMCE